MGNPSLLILTDYLELLAEMRPEKLERAAVRWHGRFETETAWLTLAESQLALSALTSLCAGVGTPLRCCAGCYAEHNQRLTSRIG